VTFFNYQEEKGDKNQNGELLGVRCWVQGEEEERGFGSILEQLRKEGGEGVLCYLRGESLQIFGGRGRRNGGGEGTTGDKGSGGIPEFLIQKRRRLEQPRYCVIMTGNEKEQEVEADPHRRKDNEGLREGELRF